jgi:hypothetical protein
MPYNPKSKKKASQEPAPRLEGMGDDEVEFALVPVPIPANVEEFKPQPVQPRLGGMAGAEATDWEAVRESQRKKRERAAIKKKRGW